MIYKHSIVIDKPWPAARSVAAHFHEMIAKWREAFKIPTGYEDESGFHYGTQPVAKEMVWPQD